MRKFLVNIDKFIRMLFPWKWQKAITMAWLKSIVAPVTRMGADFDAFRESNLYRLSKGPQVVQIESVLNDRWDFVDRRIEITDADAISPLYLYREAESKPAPYIYTEAEGVQAPYIYTETELNQITVDFVVRIPVSIVFDMDELKALVDRYRLPGKIYIVETF